jgi:hypothetical protein
LVDKHLHPHGPENQKHPERCSSDTVSGLVVAGFWFVGQFKKHKGLKLTASDELAV